MIVVDTSVIYALLDGADAWHQRVAAWYGASLPSLATTPLVVAEVDHLAGARAGTRAQDAWRADLKNGAYDVIWWPQAEAEIVELAGRYRGLGVDLTDASLVVLANRLGCTDVATLDERHFRAVRPVAGDGSFRLLPADA